MGIEQNEHQPEISPFSIERRKQAGEGLITRLEEADVEGIIPENEHEHFVKQKLGISGTQDPEVLK